MAGCAMSSPPPRFLEGSFFVRSGTVSPSRPAKLHRAARAAAVKTGRRPPPKAARSGLDGGEHGAMLPMVGRTSTPPPLTQLLVPTETPRHEIASARDAPRNDRGNLVEIWTTSRDDSFRQTEHL